ncbi:GNAT family N-acetyltransferase, partial [Chromobacterium amazonense]
MRVWNREGLAAPIATPRLRLWPLGPEHAEALFPLLRQPRVYDWISMRQPESVSALARRWGELRQEGAGEREEYFFGWAAQRISDGAWLGALDADVRADGVASNVGYWFGPDFWGQGYASEALTALAHHLDAHGAHEQRAAVTRGNDASMRVLERAGFVRGRVLPDNDVVGGRLVDDVEFVRYRAASGGLCLLRARPDETRCVADILSEAAAWLRAGGREMWLPEEVAVERVAADVTAGWFHFIERAGDKLGVVKIQYDDPWFWPDVAAGESVFLHQGHSTLSHGRCCTNPEQGETPLSPNK